MEIIQNVVDLFLADPSGFSFLGAGHLDAGKVYRTPCGHALKVYGYHRNKEAPAERARSEFSILASLQDLPGVARVFGVTEREGVAFLLREAGDPLSNVGFRHFCEVQATLEALADRGVILGDDAQVLVRPAGGAFVYDFDVARQLEPQTSQRFLWEQAERSLHGWLRDLGYPQRSPRRMREARLTMLREQLSCCQELGGSILKLHQRDMERLESSLRREDLLLGRLKEGEDVSLACLFEAPPTERATNAVRGRSCAS